MAVSVGVAAVGTTVNVTALLVPTEVVTVTSCEPPTAVELMMKVAVAVVDVETATLLAVTPVPAETVMPDTKLVPKIATFTDDPAAPKVGRMEVRVGTGGTIL